MKLLILPIMLLTSLFSSALYSAVSGSATVSPMSIEHQSAQPLQNINKHCAEHIKRSGRAQLRCPKAKASEPLNNHSSDCGDMSQCCAQHCYPQFHLNLNSISDTPPIYSSFTPQQALFNLAQGVVSSIERPPKL